MDFLGRHKGLVAVALLALAYWHFNPAERFGIISKHLVVYDRIPFAFFDIYITPEGDKRILEDINKPSVYADMCQTMEQLQQSYRDRELVLLVGTGFNDQKEVTFIEDDQCAPRIRLITVKEMPSDQAARTYNALKDQGKEVALVLRLKNEQNK